MNRRKEFKSLYKAISGGVFVVAALLLLLVSREVEGFAEWYSHNIYSVLVATAGRGFGWFPFSVSELLLYVFVLLILAAIGRFLYRVIRKSGRKAAAGDFFSMLLLSAGFLFFIYAVNCGVNYGGESFSESAEIEVKAYSTEDLKEVCQWLTKSVNETGRKVERDAHNVMIMGKGERAGAVEAMEGLSKEYSNLAGYYPPPKGLFNSAILSIQNLTGIYSPFTIEANYNKAMPAYNVPFTACHELSHLRGFMQEQEANFIGWLACRNSGRKDFQYSSDLMGWIYCTNVLKKVDGEAYAQIREELEPEVVADLEANSRFWERYDTRIAEVSNQINDTYLKANGQSDGVKSYDRMVDLIVAFYFANR